MATKLAPPQATYTYQALESPTGIRILKLQPDSDGGPLAGEILHLDMADDPAYEALSYVWGCPDPTAAIITSTGSIPIASNLTAALQQIREQDTEPRYIWADAICIDQQNLHERGHQVKLMGDIYERATKVLIWLGPDPESMAQRARATLKQQLKTGSRSVAPDEFGPISCLLRSDWFSRVWVIQEFRLAQDAVFLWGSTQMSAIHLHQNIGQMEASKLPRGTVSWFTQKADLDDFLASLQASRSLSCSDDRDRIYGLLGLPYDSKRPLTKALRAFDADYTVAIERLFLEIACLCIEHGEVAVLLSQVDRSPDQTNDLPSWIPDWRLATQAVALFDIHYVRRYLLVPQLHTPDATVDHTSGTLRLKGIAVGHIGTMMDEELDADTVMTTLNAVACYWVENLGSQRDKHKVKVKYAEADLAFARLFF